MIEKNVLFAAFAVSTFNASATTIALPTLSTQWSTAENERSSIVQTSDSYTLDLSDRTDLTVGMPIKITISSTNSFYWLGGFHTEPGAIEINIDSQIILALGDINEARSFNLLNLSSIIPEESQGGAFSDPAGFAVGPNLSPLSMIVPWDSDLSQVKITIEQNSQISGAGNYFHQSQILLNEGGQLGTASIINVALTSVPEPSSGTLFLLAGLSLCGKRRR